MQLQAVSYHGGLDSETRAANLAVFRDTDKFQVTDIISHMCATQCLICHDKLCDLLWCCVVYGVLRHCGQGN